MGRLPRCSKEADSVESKDMITEKLRIMKRSFVVLFLACSVSVWGQTPPAAAVPPESGGESRPADSLSEVPQVRFGDLYGQQQREWERGRRLPVLPPLRPKGYPWESETSVVQVHNRLPVRIDVPLNTPRRIATSLWISNGQAWNWGAYPDAFLDARTLSMPLPR